MKNNHRGERHKRNQKLALKLCTVPKWPAPGGAGCLSVSSALTSTENAVLVNKGVEDIPGGPAAKTPSSQRRGPGSES